MRLGSLGPFLCWPQSHHRKISLHQHNSRTVIFLQGEVGTSLCLCIWDGQLQSLTWSKHGSRWFLLLKSIWCVQSPDDILIRRWTTRQKNLQIRPISLPTPAAGRTRVCRGDIGYEINKRWLDWKFTVKPRIRLTHSHLPISRRGNRISAG